MKIPNTKLGQYSNDGIFSCYQIRWISNTIWILDISVHILDAVKSPEGSGFGVFPPKNGLNYYFFMLVSHQRPVSQRMDDPVVGWLNHLISLYISLLPTLTQNNTSKKKK